MTGYPWGGSEVLWSQAAHILLKRGQDVFCSVPRWPSIPGPIEELRAKGAKIDVRYRGVAPTIARLAAKILRRPSVHLAKDPCWQRIVDFTPDLVCISHGAAFCGVDWMLRCQAAGIPYVSVAHANFEQWWPDDERSPNIRKAYMGARKAYFVSMANLSLFERQLGLRLSTGEVVRNPYNIGWDTSPVYPQDDRSMNLACVGRLDPGAKGQDLLFQVLALPKWQGRSLTVSLFGRGPYEEALRLLVEQQGVADKVVFAGHMQDIENIWRTHHALILPSRYEGLPLVVVEAMLCGRPVIVTNVAGNAELVTDNVTGFVAEAPTVHHLDEAMERAWQRRHEWRRIGAVAAESVRLQIPKNPADVFANKLLGECLGQGGANLPF